MRNQLALAYEGDSESIDKKLRTEKDNSLFSGDKTTAVVNTIAGLDDFELIAFLVIYDPQIAQRDADCFLDKDSRQED